MAQKRKVFISHITQEAKLASQLKAFLGESFADLSVFVSSDPDDLPLGKRWLDVITSELVGCCAELVICSPQSIGRPWVNFELGAGWARADEDLPVIPLCHSGLTKGQLPQPLGALQAADLNSDDGVFRLVHAIATRLGDQVPEAKIGDFVEQVKDFEANYTLWDGIKASLAQLDSTLRQRIRSKLPYEVGLSVRDEARVVPVLENLERIGLLKVQNKGTGLQQSRNGGMMTQVGMYAIHPGHRYSELIGDERFPQ